MRQLKLKAGGVALKIKTIKPHHATHFVRHSAQTIKHHSQIHQSLIALTLFVLLQNILTAQAATSTAGLPKYIVSDPYEVADTVRLLSDYTSGINEDPDQIAYNLEENTSGNFISSESLVASQDSQVPDSETLNPTAPPSDTPPPAEKPPTRASKYVVQIGDTLSEIASRYSLKIATIKVKNNLSDADNLKPGQTLEIPTQDLSDKAIKAAEERKQASASLAQTGKSKTPKGSLGLIVPISSKGISRGVQPGHDGVDYRADVGTPVYAAASGVVAIADANGWNGGFGKTILIACAGGMTNRYGHLSQLNVSSGQVIKQGQLIGWSGNTGNSTGPHLHFEVRVSGRVRVPF